MIFDVLSNNAELWQINAIHRDLLLIIKINTLFNEKFKMFNYADLCKCNITYLLSLNINVKLFKKKAAKLNFSISTFNYRSIKNFKCILIKKKRLCFRIL